MELETSRNPLDLLEEFINANDWPFQRASDDELVVEIRGRWCDYHMCFVWENELRAIFFSCQLDQKIPRSHRQAVHELLAQVNDLLWLGHFGLTSESAMPMFRHTIPLRGMPGASIEQLEDVVDTALTECERFYPALQLVVWGGRSVSEAIAAAHMDTIGEA
jgi:hypothetical protein